MGMHNKNVSRRIDHQGYVWVRPPEGYVGPKATNRNWVKEHNAVLFLNGITPPVRPMEVHHINLKRDDNRIENLQIMHMSDHSRLHQTLNPKVKPLNHGISGYSGNYKCRCEICKEAARTYSRLWSRKNIARKTELRTGYRKP